MILDGMPAKPPPGRVSTAAAAEHHPERPKGHHPVRKAAGLVG
jgi:hypothetical protein